LLGLRRGCGRIGRRGSGSGRIVAVLEWELIGSTGARPAARRPRVRRPVSGAVSAESPDCVAGASEDGASGADCFGAASAAGRSSTAGADAAERRDLGASDFGASDIGASDLAGALPA
ncbi:hypothetical protein, partial [Rhodococcus sp. BS-15]|uniref:hypothetical protein n=1 Tax=Rhodococcus sp. BS-15 TaxID=1304954 RepID=UPI001F24A8A0